MTQRISHCGGIAAAAAAVLLALTPGAAAADPGEATHIDTLAAVVDADGVMVSGQATFVDAPVLVGIDPAGDTTEAPVGDDLTTATIARPDPFGDLLTFTLGVADQPRDLNGIPEAIRYLWRVTVSDGSGDVAWFWLEAFRSNQTARPGELEPVFRLVRQTYVNLVTTAVTLYQVEVVVELSGSMADGVVQWHVPMTMLGAASRSLIETGLVLTEAGVSAPGLWLSPGFVLDVIEPHAPNYTVPDPAVRIGIAPVGAPPQEVELATAATVEEGGAFTANLPAPTEAGDYTVVAEACYGDDNCARSAVTITV